MPPMRRVFRCRSKVRTLVLLAAVAAGTILTLQAQAPPPLPRKFEVASIRRNTSTDTPAIRQQVVTQQQRLMAQHVIVRELIRYAYGYQFRPLSLVRGGPDWLDSERYDVLAQADAPFVPDPRPGMLPAEAAEMLRSLLAERMKLKVRFEMREENVYALVPDREDGKPGAGLTPSAGTCIGSLSPVDAPGPGAQTIPRCPLIIGPAGDGTARFEMGNVTIADLASMLGNFPVIDALVVDQSGLTGRYDMKVRFQGAMRLRADGPPLPNAVDSTELPTLPGAIRQQLGLRLNRTRAMVETIVIEQVERPSEN